VGHDLGPGDQDQGLAAHIKPTLTVNQYEIERTNDFKILSLNARSINNKFQKIRDLTHGIDADILCIQETWNTNNGTDYSIAGYHKPELKTRIMSGEKANGGGVGIWVKDNIDYEIIKTKFMPKHLETVAVHLIEHKLIICNVYRPPGDIRKSTDSLEQVIADIQQLKGRDVILTGDFNVDLMNESIQANRLLNCTLQNDLIQLITAGTRQTDNKSTLIDHVYVNLKACSSTSTYVITTDISDHFATLTTHSRNNKAKARQKVTKRWFTPVAYDMLSTMLEATDWSPMKDMNADEGANYLELKINEYSDIVAPIESKNIKKKKLNQWTTQGIRISLKQSAKLYKTSKKSPTEDNKLKYKRYKRLLDKVNKKAKDNYYRKLICDAGNDSRRLWSIINEVVDRKQSVQKIPSIFKHEGKDVKDKGEIANLFNRYFAQIGKQMADSQPDVKGFEEYLEQTNCKFSLRKVNKEEVEKIMAAQKPKLSCGIDTINNKLVKSCCKGLSVPMTEIINRSIQDGCVPLTYKKARLIPLYKKGSAGEFGNYRPVSLLSALSKILEKVVCKQMMNYLDHNNLLCPDQFGFRPKSQTNHVIQKMMNKIAEESEKGRVTLATYLDLSKAFDCLQYNKLFAKLKALGFDNKTMKWFESYLSDRKQCVDLEGVISAWENVELGVPQGSIIGPVLFLLYINDVNRSDSDATFTKFADDTTVLISGASIQDATERMNKSMYNIDKWFAQNKLNLNPSKTRYMIFNPARGDPDKDKEHLVKIGDEYLQRVWKNGKEKAFKLVGVWIDEELKWKHHIEGVSKKVNSANFGLAKAGKSLDIKNKRLIYMGLVQSHLVFGSPFWGMAKKTRLRPLITAQKRAIRKVHNLKYRDHTHNHFVNSGILKLEELIEYSTLTYIHSSIDFNSPSNISKLWDKAEINTQLRDRGIRLTQSKCSKQWVQDLPPNKQAKLWNHNPVKKNTKKSTFKTELKKKFLSTYVS
jgi:exonuclease III